MRRLAVVVAAAIGLLVPLTAPTVAAPRATSASSPAAAALRSPPLIEVLTQYAAFSPNDDGRQDTQRLRFSLRRAAAVRVTVRVRGEGVVRGPVRLGRLVRGDHSWRWDGRDDRGRVVADRFYVVRLTAVREARGESASSVVEVDTLLERGTVRTTRPIVFPRATTVSDLVQLVYLQPGWDPWEEEFFLDGIPRATLEVKAPSGQVVRRRTAHGQVRPVFAWYGRDNDGGAVPPGEYTARVTVNDDAGNLSSHRRTVTVSQEDLVEQTWTETVAAADAGSYAPYFGGCNGCPEYCGPVSSDRFPAGLSFRHPCENLPDYFHSAAKYFAAEVPVTLAPIDSYRILATGGPAEAGSEDTGELSGAQVGPGDGTFTTPWRGVDLTDHPYLTTGQPAVWRFSTRQGSYDVASFTVEYRHYVPAE